MPAEAAAMLVGVLESRVGPVTLDDDQQVVVSWGTCNSVRLPGECASELCQQQSAEWDRLDVDAATEAALVVASR